jgi:RNA polymerase sigma-70 factor (ECF subfamily)
VEHEATGRLEALERQSRINQALGLLSPDQRHCIELAFFEGLTHTQIAERLKSPLGTVKSRILLGMGKLRQALSPS